MRRWRKFLALVGIAIIALAAVVPTSASGDALAFLTPVWLEFQPDVAIVLAPADSIPAADQPVSLRSLAAFRAPPDARPS
jgi:hypothetical protein